MDDMILWSPTKTGAKDSLVRLSEFLWEHLGLRLSGQPQVNRSTHGISFCGHRIFPGIIRLTKRRQGQYVRTCQRWERRYIQGRATATELQNGYASAYSISKLADTLQWRLRRLGQHLVDEA
jgi:ribosomal protein L24E